LSLTAIPVHIIKKLLGSLEFRKVLYHSSKSRSRPPTQRHWDRW